jgi:hypothetical protein
MATIGSITGGSTGNSTLTNIGTLSKTIAYSGAAIGNQIVGRIIVNGTQIGETLIGYVSNSSGTVTVSYTISNLYGAATGSSPTGAVVYRIQEYTASNTLVSTSNSSAANLSFSQVSGMVSSASFSTTANPWQVENPTNFIATWSRSHSAIRARVRVYIGTTSNQVMNYFGFGTSMNRMPTSGEISVIDALMTTSPRDLIYRIEPQFQFDTATDLSGTAGNVTITRTGGVSKNLFTASTISSFNGWAIENNPSVTLSVTSISTVYHKLTFKVASTTVKTVNWGTTSSGSISFNNTERGVVLDAFSANGLSTTVSLEVETFEDSGYTTKVGSSSTSSVSVTATAATPSGFNTFTVQGSTIPGFNITSNYSGFTYGVRIFNASGTALISEVVTSAGATSYTTTSLNDTIRGHIYNSFSDGATSALVTVQLRTLHGSKQIGSTQTTSASATVSTSTFSLTAGTMSTGSTNTVATANITTSSSLFKHTVRFNYPTIGNKTFTDIAAGTSTQASTLNTTEQNNIYNAHTTVKQITVNGFLTTRYTKTDGSGTTINIGSSESRTTTTTVSFPDLSPTVTVSFTIESGAGTTLYLQNWTSLRAELNITYKNSATFKSSSLNFAGTSGINVTYVVAPPFTTSGSKTFNYSITDSRDYVVTSSASTTILAYEAPKLTTLLDVRRSTSAGVQDLLGTYVSMAFTGTAANPSGLSNTLAVTFKYRELPSGVFGITNLSPSGGVIYAASTTLTRSATHGSNKYTLTTGGGFLTTKRYAFEISLTDKIQTSKFVAEISTGEVPMALGRAGVGIGKIPESNRSLDVEGDAFINGVKIPSFLDIYPVGAIYMSVDSTSPATLFGGTWVAIENTFLVAAGSSYTAGSTGGSATHTHTTPSHTHTVADHTHSIPSHTHTGPAHTHTVDGHTHTIPAHSHSLSQNGYAQVNVTGVGGSYVYLRGRSRTAWTPTDRITGSGYVGNTTSQAWGADLAGTTDESSAIASGSGGAQTTSSSGTGATGAWSGTTGSGGGQTTSSNNGGDTGSSSSLPPYLSVYMWRRTV